MKTRISFFCGTFFLLPQNIQILLFLLPLDYRPIDLAFLDHIDDYKILKIFSFNRGNF